MAHIPWVARVAAVLALVAGLSAQSLAGQWEPASLNAGPQAANASPVGGGGSWLRVQKLKAGRAIIIGVSGRQPMKYTLLAADGGGLVVLKPADKKPGRTVTDALIAVGAAWPDVLAGQPNTRGDVEIKSGGVYAGGKRLTDLAAVVERIDRAAVTEVRGLHTKSAGDPSANVAKERAIRGAAIGAGIGVIPVVAFVIGYNDWEGSSPASAFWGGCAIYGGIGALIGGLVGWAGADEHATFYVAPKGSAQPLDDVPWERLRLALPPSLQGAGSAQRAEANVRPSPAPSAGSKGSPWSVTF
jgi:hypothetical protein